MLTLIIVGFNKKRRQINNYQLDFENWTVF